MAIKSYLAHPNRGQKEKFINELSALKNCNGGPIAAQINVIMLISELFREFYAPTYHSEIANYLFFG